MNKTLACITPLALLLLVAPCQAGQYQLELNMTVPDLGIGGLDLSMVVDSVVTGSEDPTEAWANFSLAADDVPVFLSPVWSDDTGQISDFYFGYGPTFGWAGGELNSAHASINGTLSLVLSGPEWNGDTITGTGYGSLTNGTEFHEFDVSSWSVTLIPGPSSAIIFSFACFRRSRRRR